MNAKKQLTWTVTLGTNDDRISLKKLREDMSGTLVLLESIYNRNPKIRCHIKEK